MAADSSRKHRDRVAENARLTTAVSEALVRLRLQGLPAAERCELAEKLLQAVVAPQ